MATVLISKWMMVDNSPVELQLHTTSHGPGFVWLVGAGPGHPGYLTLRAVECLRDAQFILYDRLVDPRLLRYFPASAQKVCVEELAPAHPDRFPHINSTLIQAAREGLRVVRLKGGDPSIFGRGAEEAQALREANIPYEIVPGVTAALGAAACAAIPLTHRDHSSAVAIITGHEQPGRADSRLDWDALARFPGTLVFYMGMARLGALVKGLTTNGKSPSTPAAVVEFATRADQRTVTATLAELPSVTKAANIQAPALVIIGEVVRVREQIAWFEQRPLFGKQVIVTRPQHQSAEMMQRLENLGAKVGSLPTVEIAELVDWSKVDAAIEGLSGYDWLVFTSSNGVEAFIRRLRTTRDLRALGHLKLAVIGPSTAEVLRAYHLEADVVPTTFNSEGLVEALRGRVVGQRVLLARADRGLELLREELSQVAHIEQVAVYRQVDTEIGKGGNSEEILGQLSRGEVDYVTLTSSNIARAFLRRLDQQGQEQIHNGRTKLITISPRTSAAVHEAGFPVAAEAREYTSEGVIEELLRFGANSNEIP
jgi:uroporphyrinogen III methyltransferase/synthase